MATTPNFNWSTPDNTGLVKNGALDIRTLGNSIDASMADLKGGTTGQVLTKASNTDMDFSWVADATGIPATIFDAKGDIIAATAADTASRLAVGTNGQVLTADSTAATGLKWATASGGSSKVVQVVAGTASTGVNSFSSTYIDTGLTATITPTSSSNKIIVWAVVNGVNKQTSNTSVDFILLRGGTTIGTYLYNLNNGSTSALIGFSMTMNAYDSPATTSATTYKVQFCSDAGTGSAGVMYGSPLSTIILMEVTP